MILYKCHMFGINPPALISTVVGGAHQPGHHSSVAWRAHELLQGGLSKRSASSSGQTADCSLCLNVERKYQCAWCQNQCRHSDQCSSTDLQAGSTCPPPRIDSVSFAPLAPSGQLSDRAPVKVPRWKPSEIA